MSQRISDNGQGEECDPLQFSELFDATIFSVDVRHGAFEPDIAQGKHIRIAEDHDSKYCKGPWSDTLDAC